MAKFTFLAQCGILMTALQQHLKALPSTRALCCVWHTAGKEPFPQSCCLKEIHSRDKADFPSFCRWGREAQKDDWIIKEREETLAELGIASRSREESCMSEHLHFKKPHY